MGVFFCPVCKQNHTVHKGDTSDYICQNSIRQYKQFTQLPKVTQLTQNNWNISPYTREDVYCDVTIQFPVTKNNDEIVNKDIDVKKLKPLEVMN